jgi:peptide/nickel transport system ATP-binding protein
MNDDIVMEVKDLKKYYPIKAGMFGRVVGQVRAVDGVSFSIRRGTTMGLVGESGCGKTTIGKTLLRLNDKTSGSVLFKGQEIFDLTHRELQKIRPQMQIIFQDPYSSLCAHAGGKSSVKRARA